MMTKDRVLIMVFLAVVSVCWALVSLVRSLMGSGGSQMGGAKPKGGEFREMARGFAPMGYRISRQIWPGIEERILTLIAQAGGLEGLGAAEFFGIQFLGGLSAGLAAFVILLAMNVSYGTCLGAALLLGFLGWYIPYSRLMATAKSRRKEIQRELPFCLDLLATSMQAGYDFGAAVNVYIERGKPGPLKDELALMSREIRLGKTRREALETLADRTGLMEVRKVATAVIQGSEMGTGVAEILGVQGDDFRKERFRAAEKKASHAPAKMIFPMALLIVPATMVVIITPIVIKFIRK